MSNLQSFSWMITSNRQNQQIWTGDLDCRDVGREIIIHCRKKWDDAYLVTIEAPSYGEADREMRGQITDGIFENAYVTEKYLPLGETQMDDDDPDMPEIEKWRNKCLKSAQSQMFIYTHKLCAKSSLEVMNHARTLGAMGTVLERIEKYVTDKSTSEYDLSSLYWNLSKKDGNGKEYYLRLMAEDLISNVECLDVEDNAFEELLELATGKFCRSLALDTEVTFTVQLYETAVSEGEDGYPDYDDYVYEEDLPHHNDAQKAFCEYWNDSDIVEVTRRELGDWAESITASPALKDKDGRCLVSLNIKVADGNYMTQSRRTRLLEWLKGELESDFGECFLGLDNVYTAEDGEKFMIEFTIEDHGN